MTHDLVQLCQRLVRAPSFSGAEQLAAEIAARAMQGLGFANVQTDPFGSVIGIRRGAQPGKTLLFDAHLDVVAVTQRAEWHHDPFGGEIADGKIFGRGACDDKGVLAAMLGGIASVPRDQFAGTLIVSASVCEENLTGAALAHLLDQYPADGVIIGEPTQLKLGIAQKGRAGICIAARGKTAHTSRPELGDNAVYKMLAAINCLREMDLSSDPLLGREIFELTEILSAPIPGAGFVPSDCQARFVARTLPDETRAHFFARVQNAVRDLDGISITLDQLAQTCYTGATLTMPDFIQGWRAPETASTQILAALRAAGLPAETFAAPFGTNASISAARGIPSFIIGPGSIEQAHRVDEWIALDALDAGAHAYAAIARAGLTL